jgi:hypothetical protein
MEGRINKSTSESSNETNEGAFERSLVKEGEHEQPRERRRIKDTIPFP